MASPTTRNLGRMSEIAQVAVKHGFGYFFETHKLTDLLPGRPRLPPEDSPSQRGQHLREMLDELGPTFVKFGQLLSTRPDVVPPDIVLELQALQDDVRPFPYEDVERVIREELGLSIEQLFTEFEPTPSPLPRSGRCTGRRCRTANASRSRCSGRTRRGRSRPISRSSTRPPGWPGSAFGPSTSSMRGSS